MAKLPVHLYVREVVDGDVTYFTAEPTLSECVAGLDDAEIAAIGIYKMTAPPIKYKKVVRAEEV